MHWFGNYFWQKERYDFLGFENCVVGGYHGYGDYNGEWLSTNEFFVNSELVVKLYANYKPIPFLQVKAKILTNYKLELHEVNAIIEFALEIVTRDGIRDDIRKSLV